MSSFKCLGVDHDFLGLQKEFSAFDSSGIIVVPCRVNIPGFQVEALSMRLMQFSVGSISLRFLDSPPSFLYIL
jgi:hypothetical protein